MWTTVALPFLRKSAKSGFEKMYDFQALLLTTQKMLGDFPALLFTIGAIILAALFFARSRRGEGGDGGAPPGQGEAIAPIAPVLTFAQTQVLRVIAQAEATLSKPVTASNHSLAWHLLRLSEVDDQRADVGQLFALH